VNVKRNVHTVNGRKLLKYINNFILKILEDIVMSIESFPIRKRADCEECSPTEIETVFGFRQNAAAVGTTADPGSANVRLHA